MGPSYDIQAFFKVDFRTRQGILESGFFFHGGINQLDCREFPGPPMGLGLLSWSQQQMTMVHP